MKFTAVGILNYYWSDCQFGRLFVAARLLSVLIYTMFMAIMISPRINLGSLQLRFEDLLFPVIICALTAVIWQSRSAGISCLTAAITTYLLYSSAVSIALFVAGELGARAFLYLAKETLFFSQFFLVMYWGKKMRGFCGFERFSVFIIALNAGFGFYQIFTGNWYGYYGIGAIGDAASASSGSTYFTCLVIAAYLFQGRPSKRLLLLCCACLICLLATISRTFIFGGCIFLALLLLIKAVTLFAGFLRRGRMPAFAILLLVCLPLFAGILPIVGESASDTPGLVKKAFSRFVQVSSALDERGDKSVANLEEVTGVYAITGHGKSFPEYRKGTSTLAVDNQYVRHLLEIGLLGSLIWLCLLLLLAWNFVLHGTSNETWFFLAFLLTYLIMGLPLEIFQTARSGAFFWFLSGYLLVKHRDSILSRRPLSRSSSAS